MNKWLTKTCAALAAAAAFAATAPAMGHAQVSVVQATDASVEQGETKGWESAKIKFQESWDEYNVPRDAQARLLSKLQHGDFLDSEKSDAKPVAIESAFEDGYDKTIERFADGSYRMTGVERPVTRFASPFHITPSVVHGCQSSRGGSGWNNFYDCKAIASNSVVDVGFTLSYSIVAGAANDSILSVDAGSGYVFSRWGTATTPTPRVQKWREDGQGGAWASASTLWSTPGFTRTYTMAAIIGNNRAATAWI